MPRTHSRNHDLSAPSSSPSTATENSNMDKIDLTGLASFARTFTDADACQRAAAIANALLTNIEASGRRPRFSGDDWFRLGKMQLLADVPGPLDGDGDMAR